MTLIGVPRETAAGERRVALVPKVIERLNAAGLAVVVETGAGTGALIPDAQYEQAGATIGDPWRADVVVKVNPPTADEIGLLKPESTVIGFLAPRAHPEVAEALTKAGVQAFALEAIPRISRAQAMDALSSQANVAGYKAVLLAASESTRFFPMLTTAAGTVKPATVLVLGVGVAGLQALATAKRLGGRTTGYDVRPEVADQVRSVGAQWLDLGIDAAGEGGYARELTEEERAAAAEGAGRGDQRFRRGDHHRAGAGPPGAAAGHRRGGGGDEARQRGRRPGRGDRRQLRAHRAGPDRRQARRHDRLAAEPAGDDARARQRAVRARTSPRCWSC